MSFYYMDIGQIRPGVRKPGPIHQHLPERNGGGGGGGQGGSAAELAAELAADSSMAAVTHG